MRLGRLVLPTVTRRGGRLRRWSIRSAKKGTPLRNHAEEQTLCVRWVKLVTLTAIVVMVLVLLYYLF